MTPQHLATRRSCGQCFAASVSQSESLPVVAFLFPQGSVRLTHDCTQAIGTSDRGQAGRTCSVCFGVSNRSRRCPRASNCLPCSRSSQACPLAPSNKKKSTSWSTLSQSVSSPCTQASTSKNLSGRTGVSVPLFRRWPLAGGASTCCGSRNRIAHPHDPLSACAPAQRCVPEVCAC